MKQLLKLFSTKHTINKQLFYQKDHGALKFFFLKDDLQNNYCNTSLWLHKKMKKQLLELFITKHTINQQLFDQKNPDIIESLLIKGSNPNIQNYNGCILHSCDNIDVIRLLLQYKANPNIQNMFGNVPLHYHTNFDIIKLLLEKGTNPNIQTNYGNTPLHVVRENIDIIKSWC